MCIYQLVMLSSLISVLHCFMYAKEEMFKRSTAFTQMIVNDMIRFCLVLISISELWCVQHVTWLVVLRNGAWRW